MQRRRTPLEVLEATGATTIILYLYEAGEVPVSRIPEETRIPRSTVYNTLQVLLEAGLISEHREEKVFPRRRLIFLTEKGRKVAELLREIERILGDV